MAVTLRSGKVLEDPIQKSKEKLNKQDEQVVRKKGEESENKVQSSCKEVIEEHISIELSEVRPYVLPIPFS